MAVWLVLLLGSAAAWLPPRASRAPSPRAASSVRAGGEDDARPVVSIGIDLGTTNSAVAYFDDDAAEPRLIHVDGAPTMPSVACFAGGAGDAPLVGAAALAARDAHPRATFSSAKRAIGRTLAQVRRGNPGYGDNTEMDPRALGLDLDWGDAAPARYWCEPGDGGGGGAPAGRSLRPENVSTAVLRRLVDAARACPALAGARVARAVVTVPAHFDDAQKDATRDACAAAGLERVQLLCEPEAAALAYGLGLDDDALLLVVDLGGGTLDVSCLEAGGGVVEVIASAGDSRLGGDDFDEALSELLARRFRAQHGGARGGGAPDPLAHARARARLRAAARSAREALSDAERVTVGPLLVFEVG